MSLRNDIKSIFAKEGYTIQEITDKLNARNNTNHGRANLSKKISTESLRATELIEIADLLGYDIVWKKRE